MWTSRILLVISLLLSTGVASAQARDLEKEAARLDQLFLGPCCYSQTLDVHSSQPSQDLRKEIRRLLALGKTPEEVEAMVIETYGRKILAVPPESMLAEVLFGSVVAVLIAGFFLLWMGRRWVRRGEPERDAESGTPLTEEELAYRERLEDELAEVGIDS